MKKVKKKLMEAFEDSVRKTTRDVDDVKNQTNLKINTFEFAVNELKKSTLWKISECESLLQKRVTFEFVENTNRCLDDKLRKEILKTK